MARLTDEIVDEIHTGRLQHAASFNNDMGRILDDLCTSQQRRVAQGWSIIKASESHVDQAGTALQRSRFAHRPESAPGVARSA